jgi:hypothetical protein
MLRVRVSWVERRLSRTIAVSIAGRRAVPLYERANYIREESRLDHGMIVPDAWDDLYFAGLQTRAKSLARRQAEGILAINRQRRVGYGAEGLDC